MIEAKEIRISDTFAIPEAIAHPFITLDDSDQEMGGLHLDDEDEDEDSDDETVLTTPPIRIPQPPNSPPPIVRRIRRDNEYAGSPVYDPNSDNEF